MSQDNQCPWLEGGGGYPVCSCSSSSVWHGSCTKSMFVVSSLVPDCANDVPGRAKPVVTFCNEVAT
jgi:hypothetical protein